ncbi:MAG: DHA2 family efflux MFS transporter permease subunit [Caulobacteraceae bacterium]|nr:DHA2 family efflux MFS transporter permease subunit [Caulobacteraceae bacterium]
MSEAAASGSDAANRTMITVSILLATIMTLLDSTIANVALPRMAGSLSASPDQISWVLTSYIVAAAIMTPMTGWLAGRLGAKQLFVISIIGFSAASALCGASQTLGEIVVCRLLQGLFGAIMGPLSQMVLLDIYPIEQRGPVMSVWGMGTVMAPIVGPILGGWLTDDFNWRWVFYINLPVGVISLLGVLSFMPGGRQQRPRRFDGIGFALLSIALAAFQLMLDRGQNKDWFSSTEIVVEASTAGLAFILFAFHMATSEHPFVPHELLRDRNFVVGSLVVMALGFLMFSVLAILPPMMESLLGYPVITTGMVMTPRGMGTMLSIFIAGRIMGKVDDRLLMFVGLAFFSTAFWTMSHFSLQVEPQLIAGSGVIMGIGTGLIFMPTTLLAFATIDPALRGDAAGVSALLRNLGNSAGISVLEIMLTRNTQAVHSRLVETLTPDNPLARAPYLARPFGFSSRLGLASLDGEATRQASMVAYVDLFHAMMLASWILIPLVLLMRPAKGVTVEEQVMLE